MTIHTKSRITHLKSLFLLAILLLPTITYSVELAPYNQERENGFSLPDSAGKIHDLIDYRGKVVLVNFWASWCLPCLKEMPELEQLKKHFSDRPFEILAINVGENEYKVRRFIKTIKLKLPVLLDKNSKTFDSWGATTLPTSFLIDVDGNIQYRVRGNPGWENKETLSIIEVLLSEKKLPESM